MELGARRDVQINEYCYASTVWETLEIETTNLMMGTEGSKREDMCPKEDIESWFKTHLNSSNASLEAMRGELKRFDEIHDLEKCVPNWKLVKGNYSIAIQH